MVSELEARACKHAFMNAAHPFRWGRAIGPLMSYAAFFLLAALGGLTAHKSPNSTASMNTMATPNAITAQLPAAGITTPLQDHNSLGPSFPRGELLLTGEPGVELAVHQ